MPKFGELGPGRFFIHHDDLMKSDSIYGVALKVLYLKLSGSDPSKQNTIKILDGWSGEKASTEFVTISDEDSIVEACPLDPHGISFRW